MCRRRVTTEATHTQVGPRGRHVSFVGPPWLCSTRAQVHFAELSLQLAMILTFRLLRDLAESPLPPLQQPPSHRHRHRHRQLQQQHVSTQA